MFMPCMNALMAPDAEAAQRLEACERRLDALQRLRAKLYRMAK
jgi:hypothetical protein